VLQSIAIAGRDRRFESGFLQRGVSCEPTFLDQGAAARVGRWLDGRIDLGRIYAEIWKDATPSHLVDIAVFCDSDDTHTASISYFAYVRGGRS